jgi:predicted flap endonuclease-1-like 5' DNA nuclease
MVDEGAEDEHAAEPGEAVGPESDDLDTDVEDVDVDAAAEEDVDTETEAAEEREPETAEEPTTEEATDSPSVNTVKGIGPAYADRLEEAGVHTVHDLATADAAELAEQISVSEKRVGRWIDRAKEQ